MERMNYPTAHIVGPDAPAYVTMGPSPISLEDGRHSAQVDVDQQLVVGHLSIIQLPLDLYIHYRGPLAAEFAKLYENQTFGRLEQLLWEMAGVVMQADPRESLLRFANPLMQYAGECARKQTQSAIRRELGIESIPVVECPSCGKATLARVTDHGDHQCPACGHSETH